MSIRRFFYEMAFGREEWKNRLLEYLSGACMEFYQARLFQLNGQKDWVEHKLKEVETLVYQADRHFEFATKSNFDRKKAAKEVFKEVHGSTKRFATKANNTFKDRYFPEKVMQVKYDNDLTEEIWKEFEKIIYKLI